MVAGGRIKKDAQIDKADLIRIKNRAVRVALALTEWMA